MKSSKARQQHTQGKEIPGKKPRAISSQKPTKLFFLLFFLTCQASAPDMAKVG
jgi:hypothetical protein